MLRTYHSSTCDFNILISIYGDNQSGLVLTDDPENCIRTKHIDIQYYYTRHLLGTRSLTISYIPTEERLAYLLTKPLLRAKI